MASVGKSATRLRYSQARVGITIMPSCLPPFRPIVIKGDFNEIGRAGEVTRIRESTKGGLNLLKKRLDKR